MAIPGTQYQSYLWKTILTILKEAVTNSLGDEQDAESFYSYLHGDLPLDIDRVLEWHEALWVAISGQYRWDSSDDEHNEAVTLALSMIEMLKPGNPTVVTPELSLLMKKLEDLKKSAGKKRSATYRFSSLFRKSMADLFSELRYIKDAENLAVYTGRNRSATWMRRLAKIEELNRSVEQLFSQKDLATIAELLGLELEELNNNPGLVSRAQCRDRRAELILAADRVFRARETYKEDTFNNSGKLIHKKGEPKSPELPTKKYGNTVNPKIIAEFLDELQEITFIDIDPAVDHSWIVKYTEVLAESVDEESDNVVTLPVSSSPSTEPSDRYNRTRNAAYSCLDELESQWHQLGLMCQYPEVFKLFGADVYALFDGMNITMKALAKKAGLTEYHFKKAVEQAKQHYKDCVIRFVPELAQENVQ